MNDDGYNKMSLDQQVVYFEAIKEISVVKTLNQIEIFLQKNFCPYLICSKSMARKLSSPLQGIEFLKSDSFHLH